MTQVSDRTLALAAVYQAAALADKLAKTGNCDSEACARSLYSIFQQNPDSTPDVYGGIEGIRLGLMALRKQFTEPDKENLDVPKYALTLLHLADRLMKEPAYVKIIGEGIEQAAEKLDLFDHTHGNQIAALADIYKQTVSCISPRIMIQGQPLYLQNPDTQNRIRALLLAGVRSAVLWKQLGGKRTQLLFSRRKVVAEADALLQRIT